VSGPTFEVFTLFPEAISGFLRGGLIGKAAEHGLVTVHCTDYRDYTHDRHRTVDDTPYGGGPGMVMKIEPVVAALEAVTAARGPMHRILLTPSAPRFDQSAARRLATHPRIALLCGRYEGIDDRVREAHVDECLSLGDFVLNGGEVAALAIVEAVARLCEGVLGNPESAARDSFSGADDNLSPETGDLARVSAVHPPARVPRPRRPARLLAGAHAEVPTAGAPNRPGAGPGPCAPTSARAAACLTRPRSTSLPHLASRTCPRAQPTLPGVAGRIPRRSDPRSEISAPHPQAPARRRPNIHRRGPRSRHNHAARGPQRRSAPRPARALGRSLRTPRPLALPDPGSPGRSHKSRLARPRAATGPSKLVLSPASGVCAEPWPRRVRRFGACAKSPND
jgi:tRNA (guanine-N1)-methyltransferase